MKRKLLLAALCVVSAIGGGNFLHAQTNYVAGWDGGSNTASPSTFGWTSSANKTLNQRNASSGCRMTTNYSGYFLEDGETSYTYNADSDPSRVIFWVRYSATSGQSFTYTFKGLEPDHYYTFSGLVGWHNNNQNPTFTVKLNDGTNDLASMSKAVSIKQRLYSVSSTFKTSSSITNQTDIKIIFSATFSRGSDSSNDCMEAISALKLVEDFEAYRTELSNIVIPHAIAVNGKLKNSDLSAAITTAQGKVNDTNVTYDDVSALKSAITAAIVAYNYDPSGDDVSVLLLDNPGFDIDINFPSSSTTAATTAATQYPTFGWTPTVQQDCTGATIEYGYEGSINKGNATAPTTNADGETTGGALVICTGWTRGVTYKSSVTTLPAGSYRITYRAYNGNTNTSATTGSPRVGFVPTSGDSQLSSGTEEFPNQEWSTHTFDFTLDDDTEGQIQIGMNATTTTTSTNDPELFIDDVKLVFFNPLVLAQTQWQEVHDALADLDATALPDAAEDAITTELAKTVPTTSVEDVNNAKAALQALIDSYDGIKASYDKVNALIILATNEKTNSTGIKTAIEDAISTATTSKETCTNAAGLDEVYNTLEGVRQTYVTGGAQPTSGHVFDYTFMISDAAVTGTNDWTNKSIKTASGEKYTGAPDDVFFNTTSDSRDIKKVIGELPVGSYELKAATRSGGDADGNIYALQNSKNLNSTNINKNGGQVGAGELGNGWGWTSVLFDNSSKADITVGFYSKCGGSKWASADDFHLYYKGQSITKTSTEELQKYKTFYSADYNFQVDENTTIYKATSTDGNNVRLESVAGNIVPAGKAVILHTTAENHVMTLTPTATASEDDFTDNILQAVENKGTVADAYIMAYTTANGFGFYRFTGSLDKGDVYLTVPNAANLRMSIITEDAATGIFDAKVEAKQGVMYNLMGQPVDASYKGFVVKDGKTFYMK